MQGFDHLKVALSIGVQAMVRADLGGSGIMFSIDTESGFPGVVVISAAWGLGEPIVQGAVDPDRYLVFKPLLGDPRRVPILEKALGGKARKMVLCQRRHRADRDWWTRPPARARRPSCCRTPRSCNWPAGRWRSRSITAGRWTWNGRSDGETGELFIVQARPETVHGARHDAVLRSWRLRRRASRS